jgi:hypothetical protein
MIWARRLVRRLTRRRTSAEGPDTSPFAQPEPRNFLPLLAFPAHTWTECAMKALAFAVTALPLVVLAPPDAGAADLGGYVERETYVERPARIIERERIVERRYYPPEYYEEEPVVTYYRPRYYRYHAYGPYWDRPRFNRWHHRHWHRHGHW